MTARDVFAHEYDVPRGTLAKFDRYADLLTDWQTRMNLVGPSTLSDIWGRHFADSAQLVPLAGGAPAAWLDMGSGAGFPAIVVALLGIENVHLVESTTKKCLFLQAVVDALGLEKQVTIHNQRIEALPQLRAGVISARALANLGQLFDWGMRFAIPGTRWLLLKGNSASDEVAAARLRFNFDVDLVVSRTEPRSRIIVASKVRKRAT
ncbi:MAG: 16S rRNA (guanine(527)-N(7))-methyltransferase RsmG [Polymorphobacter sp.]